MCLYLCRVRARVRVRDRVRVRVRERVRVRVSMVFRHLALRRFAQYGRLGELEALLDGLGEERLEEADEGLQGQGYCKG